MKMTKPVSKPNPISFVGFDLLDGSPIRIRPELIKYYFFCVDSNSTRVCLSEMDMFDVKQTVEKIDEVMGYVNQINNL